MSFVDKSIRVCAHCGDMGQTKGGKYPPDGVGGMYCSFCKSADNRKLIENEKDTTQQDL